MIRDHAGLVVEDFRGLVNNGEDETVPQGGFITSQNNKFKRHGVRTRDGLELNYATPALRRMEIYKIEGQAQRHLFLDNAGNLYDSTAPTIPILTIGAMSDFSATTIFGRSYITPHNGVRGLPGEVVYVYSGSGLARPAAGTRPSGFTLTLADSVASGHVEAGTRVLAVAFESNTGFISGYGGFQVVTNAGGKSLDVSTIGLGPAGTVARILVSTKAIADFNGDFDNQTYYEVPDGRIPDNVATTKTVSFFDADLLNDFTDIVERLEEIPAGVGIGLYNGRMVVWGSDTDSSICYVSDSGEPEAVNAIEGFVTVNPGDAGSGLKSCWEHRGQLVCQKSQRTYTTQDNGENAAFWSVTLIDNSIGSEPHGVGQVLDFGHIIEDWVIVAHSTGLRLYNGVFPEMPLTYSITDTWDRINQAFFKNVEIVINPIDAEIFVAVPLDNAQTPNYVLYGDYSEGLSAAAIKWDLWKFPGDPATLVVDIEDDTKRACPNFGMSTGNVYKLEYDTHNDYGNAIDSWHEHALLPTDSELVNHFTGAQIKVKGDGDLLITLRGLDSVDTLTANPVTLATANRRPTFAGFNFVSFRAAVKFRVNSFDDWYEFTRFALYVQDMWE